MNIKEIPAQFRPREKALHYGIENIADDELLALIIGSGVSGHSAIEISRTLLSTYINLSSLVNANLSSLEEISGLSKIQALKLLATFELHNRLNSPANQKEIIVSNSQDIYLRYRYLENCSQEVMAILMLNNKMKIIKEKILYKGTQDNLSISPKEIYSELILSKCHKYILVHNHPDGSQEPSDEDIFATKAIEKITKPLGIRMIDHIIIHAGGYYSFSEKNLVS